MQASETWIPYCGAAPLPADWWVRWNFDPVLIAALGVAFTAALLWGRGRVDRRLALATLALIALLFVSPFCALSSALFTARVVHHILLVTLLAPMLVALLRIREVPGSLPLWTAIQMLVFWFWHAPDAYSVALSSDAAFWLMQLTLTGSACAWWARLQRAPVGSAVLSLLATMVLMGLLGAVLTFAGSAYYAPHWLATQPWGLSPLEDQQIAGIIMWAPASAIYLFCAVALLYRSLAPEPAR